MVSANRRARIIAQRACRVRFLRVLGNIRVSRRSSKLVRSADGLMPEARTAVQIHQPTGNSGAAFVTHAERPRSLPIEHARCSTARRRPCLSRSILLRDWPSGFRICVSTRIKIHGLLMAYNDHRVFTESLNARFQGILTSSEFVNFGLKWIEGCQVVFLKFWPIRSSGAVN